MKLLALSDIHGNPQALDVVLGDPRADGADVVLVPATLLRAREHARRSIV